MILKMQLESHRHEIKTEIGSPGSLELPREWWPHYQHLQDVSEHCGGSLQTIDEVSADDRQREEKVRRALVWSVRLAVLCHDLEQQTSGIWVASSPARAYQLRAASLTVDATLPFNADERRAILQAAGPPSRSPAAALFSEEMLPLLDKGRQWLAVPSAAKATTQPNPSDSPRFYLQRANEVIWEITSEELMHAPLDYDWTDLPADWAY